MGRNNNDRAIGWPPAVCDGHCGFPGPPQAPRRVRPLFVIIHLQHVGSFLPNTLKSDNSLIISLSQLLITTAPPQTQSLLAPADCTTPRQPCPPPLPRSSPGLTPHPASQASPTSTSSIGFIILHPITGINPRRLTAQLVSVPPPSCLFIPSRRSSYHHSVVNDASKPQSSTRGKRSSISRKSFEVGLSLFVPFNRRSSHVDHQAHIDYLCSQSRLLRRFFGGSTTPSASNSTLPSRPPQFLSSSNSHPVVYLPIPDPSSFDLLLHWMYHGSMNDIELALDDGIVTWEGLARNVEYLDIRDDVRQFLGRWYARTRSLCDESDSDESSDSEEDGIFSPVESPIVDPDTDADGEDEDGFDGTDEKCGARSPKKTSTVNRLHITDGIDVPRLLAKSKPLRVTIQ